MNVLYYSVVVVVLFVGYQYVAIISKKALGTHIEPTKKDRRTTTATSPTDLVVLLQKPIDDIKPLDTFNV